MTERLDRFMARANAAYYANRDPFADFVTSPEISQVFGEILGLWVAIVWQAMESPTPVVLAESGPGQGHLMQDALRAAGRALPGFVEAISLHFIETSPRLREMLAERFPHAAFHDGLDSLPDGPLLLLANEFLDALPIRQFVRRGGGWVERYVSDGAFLESAVTDRDLPDDPDGSVREAGDAAAAFVSEIAARIAAHGGAALFIDYGPAQSGPGDSLQAIMHGRPADPLAAAGEADLTAHVDFATLARHARACGCHSFGPIAQGAFLSALGIHERTAALGRKAAPEDAARLLAATRRLTAPEAMGSLFKAWAMAHPSLDLLPGFPA